MRRSFRQLETQQHALEYAQRLNREWPERVPICQHIAQQVATTAAQLNTTAPHILELCCGPGVLAEALLAALPTMCYVGIDLSPTLLAFTRQRIHPHAGHVTLIQADLNEDAWLKQLAVHNAAPPFHAVVTMQSLHDLGGEPEVSRIYGLARELLAPGGLFLNADLIVAPGAELPNNPGRRPLARHLELLKQHGYTNSHNTLTVGGFGCVSANRPR
ncbi:MAG: class I SAM-dependent methyltransferase [Caldilineaceae bacterium]